MMIIMPVVSFIYYTTLLRFKFGLHCATSFSFHNFFVTHPDYLRIVFMCSQCHLQAIEFIIILVVTVILGLGNDHQLIVKLSWCCPVCMYVCI